MILLDTHVLIWWRDRGRLLSKRAASAIATEAVAVSPITFWEIGMLVRKRRIQLDRDLLLWIADLHRDEPILPAPLSEPAAARAGLLPTEGFIGDPMDAMLYCTAADLGATLVTKDRAIIEFARKDKRARTLW